MSSMNVAVATASASLAIASAFALLDPAHVGAQVPPASSTARAYEMRQQSFFVRHDADVTRAEPGPHSGGGRTTAYRYFDDVTDAGLIFRKRALHPGAAIGVHPLTHDEVYYVLSGRGELTVDGSRTEVGPGTAIFMRLGASVGLRQLGDEDLVIIIAYPPPVTSGTTPSGVSSRDSDTHDSDTQMNH